jgi:hypothetical protein
MSIVAEAKGLARLQPLNDLFSDDVAVPLASSISGMQVSSRPIPHGGETGCSGACCTVLAHDVTLLRLDAAQSPGHLQGSHIAACFQGRR